MRASPEHHAPLILGHCQQTEEPGNWEENETNGKWHIGEKNLYHILAILLKKEYMHLMGLQHSF